MKIEKRTLLQKEKNKKLNILVARRSGELKSLIENLFLRRNSSDEVVTLAEQAVGSALQIEARRNGMEEQLGALEVRLGVSDVVRVLEEKRGDSEASLDFDDGEERYVALAYGFQTLHRLLYLAFLLVEIS